MIKENKCKIADYEILRTIGEGSFGKVKLARNKNT